ncbi:MaoC family dehydratase [Pseudorhodoferax sp.]|uniref:MaoC family dehydratase n=1 Tax=Pseudorhodoferax sp. TaxID=1993553 RepID=UPI002DD62F2E|nr:MaoC family dehydratase [Pseudorhodoferax sp.]
MITCSSLEEIEALRGQPPALSGWRAITQSDIDRFADLTGDHQWIHVDPARAARESPFGGTIVHGFLTLAMTARLFNDAITLENRKSGLNYGFDKLRFVTPVPAGAKVRAGFQLAEAQRIAPGTLQCGWDVQIEAEGAARPAIAARWLTRVNY